MASVQHHPDNKRSQIIYELRVAFPSSLRTSALNPIQNGYTLTWRNGKPLKLDLQSRKSARTDCSLLIVARAFPFATFFIRRRNRQTQKLNIFHSRKKKD